MGRGTLHQGVALTVSARTTMSSTRSTEYLRRQAAALQRFHGQDDRTKVAARIGLSVDQYKRYLLGVTTLRVDMISPFASAYGTTEAELLAALGFSVAEPGKPDA
jgi:hypothetical protein